MKLLTCLFIMFSLTTPSLLFDFKSSSKPNSWVIVDDVVMGGRSSGSFNLDKNGNGVFQGHVSLENNGGFSSLRHRLAPAAVNGATQIYLRLKGDGKDYQFRVKPKAENYFSYISPFSTTGEWQEVLIPLKDMYPSFRGIKLDQPNFHEDTIEELTFLIANKRNEKFKLVIDKIELR